MASKTEKTPQKEEMLEKDGPETLPDSPLLDLSDAAVKKFIRSAKKRGRLPPSRPSSSPRWSRPSTTLPTLTSGDRVAKR